MHPLAPVSLGRARQNVKVIGQKHVGVNLHLVTTKRFLQQCNETLAILLVSKNALSPVPSGAEMIKRSLELQPQRPSHAPILNNRCKYQMFRYDPIPPSRQEQIAHERKDRRAT